MSPERTNHFPRNGLAQVIPFLGHPDTSSLAPTLVLWVWFSYLPAQENKYQVQALNLEEWVSHIH